jgi:protease-4
MSDNNGREWQLLEKITLASVDEQKKARRWSIFFKLLTFAYINCYFSDGYLTL